MQAVKVWDRSTRLFHWINVACVLCLTVLGLAILNEKSFGVSAEGKILLKTLHSYVGYVLATSASGRSRSYLGHNPLGRLMVLLLLILLITQATTGLILTGTDLYKPPFGGAFAEWVTAGDADRLRQLQPGSQEFVDPAAYQEMRAFRKPAVTIHLYAFYLLMAAILLHIMGVVVGEFRERSGLVTAMITGRKFVQKLPADSENEAGDSL